ARSLSASQSTMLPRKENSHTSSTATTAAEHAATAIYGHAPRVKWRQNATSVFGGSTGSSAGNGGSLLSNQLNIISPQESDSAMSLARRRWAPGRGSSCGEPAAPRPAASCRPHLSEVNLPDDPVAVLRQARRRKLAAWPWQPCQPAAEARFWQKRL